MNEFALAIYESPDLGEDDKEYLLSLIDEAADDYTTMVRQSNANVTALRRRGEIDARYDRDMKRSKMIRNVGAGVAAAGSLSRMGSSLAANRSLKELDKIGEQIRNKQEELRANKNPMRTKVLKAELNDLFKVQEIEKKKYSTLTKLAKASSSAAIAGLGVSLAGDHGTRSAAERHTSAIRANVANYQLKSKAIDLAAQG